MADNKENSDGSFNDDELQDIMSEIENLEKDFIDEKGITADVTPEPISEEEVFEEAPVNDPQIDLQSTIDAEIAELDAIIEVSQPEIEEQEAEVMAEKQQEDNVVSILQNQDTFENTNYESTYSGTPVELSCNGDMNFNMNFALGESLANIKVDKEMGLNVQMEELSLSISEKEGCVISLPGGIKFTVPLTSVGASATKKAS
ncbi:MAG: hypothetical protein HN576_00130 [Bacteriovoracaceae bacterium]|jgi:hypothetical protein|nr:hypothetical protein [Bacteriovoracaceae bacterium]